MHKLPVLNYDFNANRRRDLRYHHDKHHQAYVDKLNATIEGPTQVLTISR
jgi:superoxide dismutase